MHHAQRMASLLLTLMLSPLNPTPTYADENNAIPTAKAQSHFIPCEKPRPVICQKDYEPVCGLIVTKRMSFKTFRNACLACSNPDVTSFELGRCMNELKH